MASAVFTIAKGRVAECYNRVVQADPGTSALVAIGLKSDGLESQADMKARDTLAAILAVNDEADGSGYARVVMTSGDLAPISPDDTNARMQLSLPELPFGSVEHSDGWGRVVICYTPNTAGADSTFLPLTMHDITVTPDGNPVTVPTGTFFRAS